MIKTIIIVLLAFFPLVYLLALAAAIMTRRPMPPLARADGHLPTVTIVIASAGEGIEAIREKIADALRLDYPADRFDVILFSDGAVVPPEALALANDRVKVVQFGKLGKTECQNRCAALATGEILLFSDLTARLAKDAMRKAVRWYADPRVGAVGGHFEYRFEGRNLEADYLRSELSGKTKQAKYGFVIGYYGPVYSVRRAVYEPMPAYYPGDLFLPIMTYVRGSYSIIDEEIRAFRSLKRSMEQELLRKRRMIAQGIASAVHFLWTHKDHASGKMDLFAAFTTRKLLRWLVLPYGLAGYFGLFFLGFPLLEVTAAILALLFMSFALYRMGVQNAILLAPYYGTLLMLANVMGIFDALRGRTYSAWNPGAI